MRYQRTVKLYTNMPVHWRGTKSANPCQKADWATGVSHDFLEVSNSHNFRVSHVQAKVNVYYSGLF